MGYIILIQIDGYCSLFYIPRGNECIIWINFTSLKKMKIAAYLRHLFIITNKKKVAERSVIISNSYRNIVSEKFKTYVSISITFLKISFPSFTIFRSRNGKTSVRITSSVLIKNTSLWRIDKKRMKKRTMLKIVSFTERTQAEHVNEFCLLCPSFVSALIRKSSNDNWISPHPFR